MYNVSTYVLTVSTYFLHPGGDLPRRPPLSLLPHSPSPLLVRWPTRIGASGPRLQLRPGSAQPATLQPLDQPQERALPRVPRQQPVDQPAARLDDLARHLDHRGAERGGLHPQERPLLRPVLLRVP